MRAPVHFDIEKMRAQFLANADRMFAEAMALTETDEDRLYVRTQRMLSPALTELLVCMAEASNQNLPQKMITVSVGITLGKMAGSAIRSIGDDPDVMATIIKNFSATLNSCLSGEAGPNMTRSSSAFAGTVGGHA